MIVDDDELYCAYIVKLLEHQRTIRIYEASNRTVMADILDNNEIDCVLMDYNLGTESGLLIWEMIRKRYPDPPPTILLTGEGEERTIVKAFRAGFSDFISKRTLNLRDLLEAITRAVDLKQAERVEKGERNRLARLSTFDTTTGLHGVDFIRQRAEELSTSARRRGGPFGAVIICIRELAGIGDAFGHIMRDRVLEAFAARVKRYTREADICGRYNEDCFLYLIDRDATPRNIWTFCERLSNELSFEANFEKASFTLAPTMGMALFPQDGDTADKVLEAAELALSRARDSGVRFAAASPPILAVDAATWSGELEAPAAEVDLRPPGASREVDRRSERRHRVVKRGKVITPLTNTIVDCRIRNLSNGGARLSVNEYYSPPDEFTLMIVDSGEKRAVSVRWRKGNDLGVQFIT